MKNLKIIKNNELKDWAEEIFKKNTPGLKYFIIKNLFLNPYQCTS